MVKDDPHRFNGIWTTAILCLGLAAIGVCVVIPQMDANARLTQERARLAADLDQINRQATVNEEFLSKIENDPQLAQRLAQRQMKFIRQGESLLQYKGAELPQPGSAEMSPFSLVRIPPPIAPPRYEPVGGIVGKYLLDSHIRLYVLAGGLFMVAMGLIISAHDASDLRPGT